MTQEEKIQLQKVAEMMRAVQDKAHETAKGDALKFAIAVHKGILDWHTSELKKLYGEVMKSSNIEEITKIFNKYIEK